uniref:Uncharacterized protein n=1 Tax=Sinocyclocheilus grahami TaxID=75366 RepID=A0A672LDF4_SINGR
RDTHTILSSALQFLSFLSYLVSFSYSIWPLDQGTRVQLVSYREVVFVLSCQFGVTGHDTHRVTQTRSNEQPLMIAWSLCTSVCFIFSVNRMSSMLFRYGRNRAVC